MPRTHPRQLHTPTRMVETSRVPSALRAIGLAIALGASLGCADAHREAMGVPAPGESASIVTGSVAWAGGRVSREETRVDSATGQFEFRWCRGEDLGGDCNLNANVHRGAANGPAVTQLFRLQNTSEFRSLRTAYVSQLTPPDPSSGWLEVTANERYQRVTWDGTARLPNVVLRMTCAMMSARGSLVLCY